MKKWIEIIKNSNPDVVIIDFYEPLLTTFLQLVKRSNIYFKMILHVNSHAYISI